MDYPVDWRQVFTTGFFLDKILKFSKIVILEFSDSPTQILMFFLSRKTVVRVTRAEYFSDDRLMIPLYFTISTRSYHRQSLAQNMACGIC